MPIYSRGPLTLAGDSTPGRHNHEVGIVGVMPTSALRRICRELVVRQSRVGVVVTCVFWMRELSWEPDEFGRERATFDMVEVTGSTKYRPPLQAS
jgi:hypothetical protein